MAGSNVLCVQGHNVGLDSSDFTLHPVLTGYSFARDNPFRALFRERVKRHMFGNGALGEGRLRARYGELKATRGPVIPEFDEVAGSTDE